MLVASVPVGSTDTRANTGATTLDGWYRVAFIVLSGLGFIALALQLGLSAGMAGRIMPGVSVAGMAIGGMDRVEARQLLAKPLQQHTVNLAVGTTTYKVSSRDIGAVYDLDATLDQAFLVGRDTAFVPLQIMHAIKSQPVAYSYQLNRQAEAAFIEKVITGSGQAPVDAAIIVNDGVPTVQPDVDGRSLSKKAVRQAIAAQLDSFSSRAIRLEPSIQHARIRVANIQMAIEQTKQLLAVPVTITYLDKTFIPTPAQKSQWISFQKSAEEETPALIPGISKDGVKNYLQSLAVQINVNPVNRKINVQNGDSQETQAGKDGL
ncbi:MAG TPA: peptidoglycan binding domain-containing protein, partial [Candidatus Saccharimonadia bacterium]